MAAALLALVAAPALAGEPFPARYELRRGGLVLGQAAFRLDPLPEAPGCQRYEYQAQPRGLARLFVGEIREFSEFCSNEAGLQPRRFGFSRADRARDDFTLRFDTAAGTVTSSRGDVRPLTALMTDRLLMQLRVRDWVRRRGGEPGPEEWVAEIVEDDRVKTYRFRITARETLETPAGRFEHCVRVERVDDPRKSTRFWLAPALDYGAVRVEQVKEGSEQLSLWRLP